MTESLEELQRQLHQTPLFTEVPEPLKNTRLKHFLASRLAIWEIFPGEIPQKDPFGKPFFPQSPWKMSISHAGSFAAVIGRREMETGIDIELIGDKVQRISHKFCNVQEMALSTGSETQEKLHLIWGAKEAMYKMYGKKEVDFKLHLHVLPFDLQQEGRLSGQIIMPQFAAQVQMRYQFFKGYCLVWVVDWEPLSLKKA